MSAVTDHNNCYEDWVKLVLDKGSLPPELVGLGAFLISDEFEGQKYSSTSSKLHCDWYGHGYIDNDGICTQCVEKP